MKRLTQEECNELPEGTEVVVTWSGGNGPHEYRIYGHFGGYAQVDNIYHDELDFVGLRSCNTAVWVK